MTRYKIALYPGTFDPVTLGHLDIINRARKIFDVLYVGVGKNLQKVTLFTQDERVDMIQECTKDLTNVKIIKYEGLTVNFASKIGALTLVRGMRAVSDFEFEFQMGLLNRKLNDNIETIFLMPSAPYIFLNSTAVKTIARNFGDVYQFVTPYVAEKLERKFR
jgi:pantetheine-phosphate adenylyltransferase